MVIAIPEGAALRRDETSLPACETAESAETAGAGGDRLPAADPGATHRYRLTYDDGSEPEVVEAPTPSEAVRLRTRARLPSGILWLDAASVILARPRPDPYPLLRRIWGDRLFEDPDAHDRDARDARRRRPQGRWGGGR